MNKRQQHSQLRRERVIESACYCFSHLGYRGSSLETIALRAGVSKALIFTFFSNKRDLYDYVLKKSLEDWTQQTELTAVDLDDPVEILRQLFTGVFEFVRVNPMIGGVFHWRDEALAPHLKLIKRTHDRWRRRLISVLSEGVNRGCFRSDLDVERTADIIHTLQVSYISRMLKTDNLGRVDDALVKVCVEFIVNAVMRGDG